MYSIDYQYLRLCKGRGAESVVRRAFWRLWRTLPCGGENATILPLRRQGGGQSALFGRGGVVDENGEYVPLSGIEGRVQFAGPAEKKEYRDETVALSRLSGEPSKYFLIEGVTRPGIFWKNDRVDKYVFS